MTTNYNTAIVDNPPTYEEVMANEGKYAVKVKLDTNTNIFRKGGRL